MDHLIINNMNHATISADIISYTSLEINERRNVENIIKRFINDLSNKYTNNAFFGRLIKGDYVELVLMNPKDSLRVALQLKTLVKSIKLKNNSTPKSLDIRIAFAIAPLDVIDFENGIIDGEAIYKSGRAVENKLSDSTFYFYHTDDKICRTFGLIISLIEILLSNYSAKKCEIIYLLLNGYSNKEIANSLAITLPAISQHLKIDWKRIDEIIRYFEQDLI